MRQSSAARCRVEARRCSRACARFTFPGLFVYCLTMPVDWPDRWTRTKLSIWSEILGETPREDRFDRLTGRAVSRELLLNFSALDPNVPLPKRESEGRNRGPEPPVMKLLAETTARNVIRATVSFSGDLLLAFLSPLHTENLIKRVERAGGKKKEHTEKGAAEDNPPRWIKASSCNQSVIITRF